MSYRFLTTLIACSLAPVSLGCYLVRQSAPAITSQKAMPDTTTQKTVSDTTVEYTNRGGAGSDGGINGEDGGGNITINSNDRGSTTTYSRTIISDGRGNIKITYGGNGKTVIYNSRGGEEHVISQDTAVGKATSLRVKTSYGSVDILPSGDVDHVHVTATVGIGGGFKDAAERKRLLAAFRISVTDVKGVLTPEVEPPSDFPKNQGFSVSYRIAVPASLSLEVESQNGAVSVRDTRTKERVSARSDYGSVSIRNTGQRIIARSENGSVSVGSEAAVSSVDARSSYGQVEVRCDAGSVDAHSENGSVSIKRSESCLLRERQFLLRLGEDSGLRRGDQRQVG